MTKINTNDFTKKASALLRFADKDVDYLIWQGDKLYIQTKSVTAYVNTVDIGETLVIPQKAIMLIKKIDSDICNIGAEENQLIVKYNRATSKFTMPTATYDIHEYDIGNDYNVIDNSTLDNIKKVARYCSTQEVCSKAQNGVYFKGNGKQLEIVAVDGFRFMIFTDYACKEKMNLVIPKEFIEKIVTLAAVEAEDIKCCELKVENKLLQKAIFTIGEFTIVVPTLAFEKFIDYKAVVDKHKGTTVAFNSEELKDAVDRIMISSGRDNSVALIIENNEFTVKTNSENKSGDEIINAKYDGDRIVRGVNGFFLMDMLSNYPGEVEMTFGNKTIEGMSIVRNYEKEQQRLYTFILPMRLKGNVQ